LEDVGIALDGPGVVTGRTVAKTFTDELVAAIGLHRAWARADDVMASAVPPA
jgi:catalase